MQGSNYIVRTYTQALHDLIMRFEDRIKGKRFYIVMNSFSIHIENEDSLCVTDIEATQYFNVILGRYFKTQLNNSNFNQWYAISYKYKDDNSRGVNGCYNTYKGCNLAYITLNTSDIGTFEHEHIHLFQDIRKNNKLGFNDGNTFSEMGDINGLFDDLKGKWSLGFSYGLLSLYYSIIGEALYICSKTEQNAVKSQSIVQLVKLCNDKNIDTDDYHKVLELFKLTTFYSRYNSSVMAIDGLKEIKRYTKTEKIQFISRYNYMLSEIKTSGFKFKYEDIKFYKKESYYKNYFSKLFNKLRQRTIYTYPLVDITEADKTIDKILNKIEKESNKMFKNTSKIITNINVY